jgi:hypothetical protein
MLNGRIYGLFYLTGSGLVVPDVLQRRRFDSRSHGTNSIEVAQLSAAGG